MLTPSMLSATDLDRDHRKREYIPLLAICAPTVQDLWWSPSFMAAFSQDATHGTQAPGCCGDADICDSCLAVNIHKDVRLDWCQCGGCAISGQSHTPVRPP